MLLGIDTALRGRVANGTDAIDRGKVAVGSQGHDGALTMPDGVAKKCGLFGDPRKLTCHNHGAQLHHRIAHRDNKHTRLTVLLVESGDLICEDVKSEATRKDRTYINKAKQMKECLGFPVREV